MGQANRDAEILAVRGEEGRPPYVVRWADTAEGEDAAWVTQRLQL